MENVYRFEDAKTFVVLTYLFFAIKQKNPDHDLEIHILTCLLKATLGDEMDLRLRFASVGCTTPWCVCVCAFPVFLGWASWELQPYRWFPRKNRRTCKGLVSVFIWVFFPTPVPGHHHTVPSSVRHHSSFWQ